MFFSALSFLAGILIVQQFSELPETFYLLWLGLLACCFVFLRYWRLMFFTTGLLWAIYFSSLRLQAQLPAQFEGQSIQIEGRVIGLPQHNERSVRFDFSVLKSKINKPEQLNLKKVRLRWYYPKQAIKPGQYWQFTVKLKKPHGRFNPGGFDYERWLFMQNIAATGYVRKKPAPQLIAIAPVFQNADSVRQFISDKLDELLGKTENRGLIKALTIGDKQELTQQQWQIFRDTGTIHLLAISGLHLGLVSGIIYFLTLKISIALAIRSPQHIAALFAIAIATFYAALAGFSLPTQRALLMLIIVMTGIVWQRNLKATNTLAIALFAVLIFDPLTVLSPGFWLSFLAVVLIVYCLAGRLSKIGYWHSAITIHWIIAIGLSPVLLFYFQQVSLISPLANLVSVPIISMLIVPLCLVGVVLLCISPFFAHPIFVLVDTLLHGLSWVLSEMASLPFATVSLSPPPVYTVILAIAAVFLLFSPKGIPARWLALILFFPLIFQNVEKPKRGEISLTVLDVGQGLSAVVETSHHVLVFDTGAKYSEQYNMGDAVVIPFLKNKAIKLLDILLISHGDNDHIGGSSSILEQIQVKKILTSVPKQLARYTADSCQAGQSWVWDQVLFEILWPPVNNEFLSDNNRSCVLKIASNQIDLLLTGDIEKNAEIKLLKKYTVQLQSDVLVSPHHGSNTSSTLVFLEQVQPSIVLIPSGYRNRFSFPHPKVLERYKKMDAKIFNTATDGALTVKTDNNLLVIETIRSKLGKYWHN